MTTSPCPACGTPPIPKTHPAGLPPNETRHHMLMCPKCFPAACHVALFARGVTLDAAIEDWNQKVEISHGSRAVR